MFGGSFTFSPPLNPSDELWSFDLVQWSWTQLFVTSPSPLSARYGHAASPSLHDDGMIVIGGVCSQQSSAPLCSFDVNQYDPRLNRWTVLNVSVADDTPRHNL